MKTGPEILTELSEYVLNRYEDCTEVEILTEALVLLAGSAVASIADMDRVQGMPNSTKVWIGMFITAAETQIPEEIT